MDEKALGELHRLAEIDRLTSEILAEDWMLEPAYWWLTPEKVREWATIFYDYERRQMDRPPGYELAANTLVSVTIGEPKAKMYDSFTFVDNRKLDQDSIDAGLYAQCGVRWARWWRGRAARRRVALGVVTINEARAETGLPPVEWPVTNPEPRWTLISDVRLEGEEAAQALGLDNEWRAMLGMPPKPASPLDKTTWEQLKRAVGIDLITETYLLVDAVVEAVLGFPEEVRLTPEEARKLATETYDGESDDSEGV